MLNSVKALCKANKLSLPVTRLLRERQGSKFISLQNDLESFWINFSIFITFLKADNSYLKYFIAKRSAVKKAIMESMFH